MDTMPTMQPRVNVVMDSTVYKNLAGFAKKENSSLSAKAFKLIKLALEVYEDVYWDTLSQGREQGTKKKMLSHDAVWK